MGRPEKTRLPRQTAAQKAAEDRNLVRLGILKESESEEESEPSDPSDDDNMIPPREAKTRSDKGEDPMGEDPDAEDPDEENEITGETIVPMASPRVPLCVPKKPTKAEKTRTETIAAYMNTLSVKKDVAEFLHDNEDLTTPESWAQMSDRTVGTIVKSLQKRNTNLPVRSAERMKLLVFFCKHGERTSREIDLTVIDADELQALHDQKEEEDKYFDEKVAAVPAALPLDQATAAKSFASAKMILENTRGAKGVSLARVIRPDPEVPQELFDPPYGDTESIYLSYDEEMIARGPIYSSDPGSEDDGPFDRGFIIDSMKVFIILQYLFSGTNVWVNVKKYAPQKQGRKAWRALTHYFFGDNKVTTIGNQIRTAISVLRFEGNRRHLNFDKYTNLHVTQHIMATDLLEYSVDKSPLLSEAVKIQAYMEGISAPEFDPMKAIIIANRHEYPTFDSVKEKYLNFYRSFAPRINRDVSATGTDRRRLSETTTGRGGAGRGGGGRGRGRGGGGEKPEKGPKPTQEEIDACTWIQNKKYPEDQYLKFTRAEAAKLYQLRESGSKKHNVSATDTLAEENEAYQNSTNRDNPALGRQDGTIKKPKKEE